MDTELTGKAGFCAIRCRSLGKIVSGVATSFIYGDQSYASELVYKEVIFQVDRDGEVECFAEVRGGATFFRREDEFYREAAPSVLLSDGVTFDAVRNALVLKLLKMHPDVMVDIESLGARFRVQASFVDDMRRFHCDQNLALGERTLESCAEAILGINTAKGHALRENSSGGSPQLCIRQYRAMRRDVDYEFHVHYWRDGELLYFANLVQHNDYGIADPEPAV